LPGTNTPANFSLLSLTKEKSYGTLKTGRAKFFGSSKDQEATRRAEAQPGDNLLKLSFSVTAIEAK
jgi:hypothetical protein